MGSLPRRAKAAGVFAAAWLLARAAPAAPVDDNAKRADALFQEAQALLDKGKAHEACGLFAESEALDPAIGTLLNLASCHAEEGKTATARAELAEAAKMAADRTPRDRKREEFALARMAELDRRMAYVRLAIPPAAGVGAVKLDGRDLDRAAWEAPIPVDPGDHTFELSGPGKKARTLAVTVAHHPGTQPLAVGELESEGGPAPLADADPARGRRIAGIALGSAGGAGVVVGAVFGALAIAKKNAEGAHCDGGFCDAEGLASDRAAHSAATVSTVAFAAGLAVAAAGTVLILTATRPAAPASAAWIRIAPSIGPGGGGLLVHASF
jgi:hypothetical protein